MFDSYFFWGMLIGLWVLLMGIFQAAEKATEIVKKVAENEKVQEAGKGVLARWMDSMFK